MLALIKKIIPNWLLNIYHRFLSWFAARYYGNPSDELVVIGVTGTNGKSTTVNLIAAILEKAGNKVAATSTVNYILAGKSWLNPAKITMPGRFFLQRFLRQAVAAGCSYAVVESSSEGVLQFRHADIRYDAMVFTNLAPEHLERHGGFENYKKAKLKLFRHLEKLPHKKLGEKIVPKAIVVNGNDEHAADFLNFRVDKKIVFGLRGIKTGRRSEKIIGEDIQTGASGSRFRVGQTVFAVQLAGLFNVENMLAAIAAAAAMGVSLDTCRAALEKFEGVPGRLETVRAGQPFAVIVDYAYEPNALQALYATIKPWPHHRIIQVLGGTGGGRDAARRPVLGQLAASNTDVVIVTTDDPYDEDPREISRQVAAGAVQVGKIEGEDLFSILDRRQAIKKALTLAQKDDLVLITGKGAEQKMALSGGRYIPWDDRQVAREELGKIMAPEH